MLKKASLGLRVLFLSLFLWAKAFCFECRVYNVGQANLVVIRHDNHSLIIDCGKAKKDIKDVDILNSIFNFINGTQISLVITHQHADHYDFAKKIHSKLNKNFQFILTGGLRNSKLPEVLSSIPNLQFCKVQENGAIQDANGTEVGILNTNTLQNCFAPNVGVLGRDVGVQLLLSDTWVGDQAHDQNLVLKVTYGRKSMLFPGDASGKLLDKIITRFSPPNSRGDLEDIDCMLLSHHGSNDSGELEWFRQVNQHNFFPLLVIVSSDPGGNDKLPWNMVKDLLLVTGLAESHQISVRGRSTGEPAIKHRKGKPDKRERERFLPPDQPYSTNKALFTTCDAGLYYAITVDGGEMMMTSNDAQGNQTLYPRMHW